MPWSLLRISSLVLCFSFFEFSRVSRFLIAKLWIAFSFGSYHSYLPTLLFKVVLWLVSQVWIPDHVIPDYYLHNLSHTLSKPVSWSESAVITHYCFHFKKWERSAHPRWLPEFMLSFSLYNSVFFKVWPQLV